jgi:flagellar operon protein
MLKISAYQKINLPEKVNRPAPQAQRITDIHQADKKNNFKTELDRQVSRSEDVKFSAHARARLHSRGVSLDEKRLKEISQAIDKAQAKGAKESLILADEAAYVVSVKNRTVITAFDRDNLRDGVFTSIDSAVIL